MAWSGSCDPPPPINSLGGYALYALPEYLLVILILQRIYYNLFLVKLLLNSTSFQFHKN